MLPPDSDERVFLRVVEAGSLKAAAAQLGTDPSRISRRLAALEARLGQRLLRRSTRGSRPTEAGARYYDGLADIVAQQDALEAAVAGETEAPRGHLIITAPPEFGVRFVIPVVEALQRAHEALTVEVHLGTGFANLGERGFDAAVRIGRLADSTLHARRLGAVPRALVASPTYLDRHGTPRNVAALSGHRFVGYFTRRGVNVVRLRSPKGAWQEAEVRPVMTANSIATVVRWVEEGEGLNLGPRWAFADALAGGRLVELFADHHRDPFPLHVVYPSRRYLPARTRAFIDAMVDMIADQPSLTA